MAYSYNQDPFDQDDFFGSWYGPGGHPAYKGSQPFHKEGYPDTRSTNMQEQPWDPGFDWFKHSASARKDVFGRADYGLMGSAKYAGLFDWTRLQAAGGRQVDLADQNIEELRRSREGIRTRGEERLASLGERQEKAEGLLSDYETEMGEDTDKYLTSILGAESFSTGQRTGGVMGDMRSTVENTQRASRQAMGKAVGLGEQALADVKSYEVELAQGVTGGFAARAEAQIAELQNNPNIPDGIRSGMEESIRRKVGAEGRGIAVQLASKAQDSRTTQSNVLSGLYQAKAGQLSTEAGQTMQMGQLESGVRQGAAGFESQRKAAIQQSRMATNTTFTALDDQIRSQTSSSIAAADAAVAGGLIQKSAIIEKSVVSLLDQVTAQFAMASSLGPYAVRTSTTPGRNEEMRNVMEERYGIDFSRTSLSDAMKYIRGKSQGARMASRYSLQPASRENVHFT